MAGRKSKLSVYQWVCSGLRSCDTPDQVDTAYRLVVLFYKKYQDTILYASLENLTLARFEYLRDTETTLTETIHGSTRP